MAMRHRLLPLATVVLLAATAIAQDVPIEKYVLPNGMKVILHQDHTLPVATINIWYGVGAQDEPPGRSGFAHLFEHLMFMGTRRVPGNQFDVLMETGGGANNASTDLHRTDYFSSGPSTLLPTLLWLDADRLEDMGLNMTQEKLDKQRDVVRNELRQSVENAPYGKADEQLWPMIFPEGHPYRTGVIGTHADLEAATVSNVKDFFANFYVPNNASLVIAGDFEPAQIKPLVQNLFGSLPTGATIPRKYVKPTEPIPFKLTSVHRATAIDKVQQPRIQYTYLSPVGFGPGDAEMRLAGMILAEGKSSRLYQRLVIEEQVAVDVAASQSSFPLASLFQVNIYTKPDADLARVEAITDEELAQLANNGPQADELQRHQATVEAAMLEQIQSVETRAAMLNEYEAAWGEPNSFRRDLERYRSATPSTVQQWAHTVLTPDARVITRVLPEEPERGPSARDQRPADSVSTPFSIPQPATFTLANGLQVLLWNRPQLPLVSMQLIVRPNAATDPQGQEGLHALTAQMLSEGAGERDAVAFASALQQLGASFSAGAEQELLDAHFTVLRRNLAKGLGLFADALTRPRLDSSAFERVKALHLEDLQQADEIPSVLAAKVANRTLFGPRNPYAVSARGTVSSVAPIDLVDVKGAVSSFRPEGASLLVVGDISQAELEPLLTDSLGGWKPSPAASSPPSAEFIIPAAEQLRFLIVDRPGATQTMIRFQIGAPRFATDDRVERELLNTLLGGSFTSRLNQNLREDHGYTYGARSRFELSRSLGFFAASAQVQAEVTGPALKEFLSEFDRLNQGDISADELAKARATLRNDTITQFGTFAGLLSAASERIATGVPIESIAADLERSQAIQAADVNGLAARIAADLKRGVLVLVGDKSVILPQLTDLKLPAPTVVDTEGRQLKE